MEEKIFQKLDAIEKIMRDTFNTSGTEINKSYLEKFYNGLKVGRSKISNSDRHDNQFADLLKHNDSVRYTNQGNIYTYYWKLNNLHTIMYKSDLYVTSSNFIVLGKYRFPFLFVLLVYELIIFCHNAMIRKRL